MKPDKQRKLEYNEGAYDNCIAEYGSWSYGDEPVGDSTCPEIPEHLEGFRTKAFKRPLDMGATLIPFLETDHILEFTNILGALPRFSFRKDKLFPDLRVKFNTGNIF